MTDGMKKELVELLEHAAAEGNLSSAWFRNVLAEEIMQILYNKVILLQRAIRGDKDD